MLRFYILLQVVFFSHTSMGQSKAIVLQNLWNNELDSYSPKEYFDQLYDVLRQKLQVKELVVDTKAVSAGNKDEHWENTVKEQVKSKNATRENAYYIALANELRLPAFNLGKFLFKNPPRSSKLTFTFHVYDTSGIEVLGDTIINRGCLVRAIDIEKGTRNFYSDYNSFLSDLKCHLEYIRKVLQEKPLSRSIGRLK
jgi:hypothetical protein